VEVFRPAFVHDAAMDAGATALARDFPGVAALSREDWQALLAESLDPVRHAEEVRLYEATVDQLPAVRAMYEAYEAQLRRMEQAAGTWQGLMQRRTRRSARRSRRCARRRAQPMRARARWSSSGPTWSRP